MQQTGINRYPTWAYRKQQNWPVWYHLARLIKTRIITRRHRVISKGGDAKWHKLYNYHKNNISPEEIKCVSPKRNYIHNLFSFSPNYGNFSLKIDTNKNNNDQNHKINKFMRLQSQYIPGIIFVVINISNCHYETCHRHGLVQIDQFLLGIIIRSETH